MTLKERLLSQPLSPTHKMKIELNKEKDDKQYQLFLRICDRLKSHIAGENISCNTYEKIFNTIESRRIDISDIISKEEYESFKKDMLKRKFQWCPQINDKESKYDLTKEEDRIRFIDENGFVQF